MSETNFKEVHRTFGSVERWSSLGLADLRGSQHCLRLRPLEWCNS
jgi:hypothetical protein